MIGIDLSSESIYSTIHVARSAHTAHILDHVVVKHISSTDPPNQSNASRFVCSKTLWFAYLHISRNAGILRNKPTTCDDDDYVLINLFIERSVTELPRHGSSSRSAARWQNNRLAKWANLEIFHRCWLAGWLAVAHFERLLLKWKKKIEYYGTSQPKKKNKNKIANNKRIQRFRENAICRSCFI